MGWLGSADPRFLLYMVSGGLTFMGAFFWGLMVQGSLFTHLVIHTDYWVELLFTSSVPTRITEFHYLVAQGSKQE